MGIKKTKRYGKGPTFRRIYLVAPRHPKNFWSMQGLVELFGAKSLMPNSALATLMALTPEDVSVEYILADENVSEIDLDMDCDLAAITGSTLHSAKIHQLCKDFRKRGVPVALGGSYATIENDKCKDIADYHFIGEAENTWPKFLIDLENGNPEKVYRQKGFIDLKESPMPDWSLVNPKDYINFNVQTSRGCPNKCDFCEVIQYLGRNYRLKSAGQVMNEIKEAHRIGARSIFFSDDNFLGNKKYTKELLKELIKWNKAQGHPLSFSTQITVQVADDDELLRLLADARFSVLFIGVETIREESLREVHKEKNLKYDIYKRIQSISNYGIVPFLGMIVGFDNDDESVFDDIYSFIEKTNSPIAGISMLNAPGKTPLYDRLKKEGRILGDNYSGEYQLNTNIIPKQITREVLINKYWELFRKIYDPNKFEKRLISWLGNIDYYSAIYNNKKMDWKQAGNAYRMLSYFILKANPKMKLLFFSNLIRAWKIDPRFMKKYFTLFSQYLHFYNFINEEKNSNLFR